MIDEKSDIIIVNSYGHVPKYLKLCKSVFIGKSLLKKLEAVGGQNPIEAAKFGCKIYHGPYVYNFKDIYQQLSKYKITEKVSDDLDLSNKISFDLNNQNGVINQNVIKDINELGNKILNKTFDEIKNLTKMKMSKPKFWFIKIQFYLFCCYHYLFYSKYWLN